MQTGTILRVKRRSVHNYVRKTIKNQDSPRQNRAHGPSPHSAGEAWSLPLNPALKVSSVYVDVQCPSYPLLILQWGK